MEPVSITLRKQHVLDVAALTHAAGSKDHQSWTRDMFIRTTDREVWFEATNAYVAVARRGTIGEFGGKVFGQGEFSVPARPLSMVLRKFPKASTVTLVFKDGDVLIDRRKVLSYTVDQNRYLRMSRILNPVLAKDPVDELPQRSTPEFSMNALGRAVAASGSSLHLPLMPIDHRTWGMATTRGDSWRFAAAILETAR